jgi:hypothetical protein
LNGGIKEADMAFPKVGEWSEKAYSASARGFNLLVDFEREIHKVYPDTSPFRFGFFSEDDLNFQYTIGWQNLKGSMFDVEDFNSTVGLRFGLRVDASDNVLYNNNFIMIMPRAYRDEVILPARKAAHQRMEKAADEDAVFVHPADPEYNKMKDAGREIAKTEKVKVQVRGTPDRGKDKKEESKDDLW